MSGNLTKIAKQKKVLQREGIKYTKSAAEAEKYKLGLPVHNMNDVLFAHLFLASNFGNWKIDSNGNYGTALVYAGHRTFRKRYSSLIRINGSNFLDGMATLKGWAEAQRGLGHRYMRVVTGLSEDAKFYSYLHAENIDIDALLDLDLDHMESEKAYAIDDRNFGGSDMSQDIPRLAVRKADGIPPTYEFETLLPGVTPKKGSMLFGVYSTDVNKHDTQYWEQFK
ncbi:MAG: hypothetical protein LBJ75_00265 [Puniceicoccales bacterium]|jgi:hypothetical protein|nr:hypothetical protein [Puniceicoccales bacterium]